MKTDIDIIILSYAKDEDLKALTIQTINTLLESEDPEEIQFNILVIESNKALQPFQFENSTTIYPEEKFGFNKFLNIGIKSTSNKYICLCNNDLVFHKGWATAMLNFVKGLNTDLIVTSPFCEKSHIDFKDETEPIEKNFGCYAGHCFFTTRQTLAVIGELDERINFWFADMDFIELMESHQIRHFLLPGSKVDHLSSRVTSQLSRLDHLKYTYYPYIYFQYKWRDKSAFKYCLRLMKFYYKYAACFVATHTAKTAG